MLEKKSRTKRLALSLLVLPALVIFILVFSRVNRQATVRKYFWLEQKVVDNWPVQDQRWEVQKLVPFMCRIGILGPVRVEVEPHVSFLLDPRDLVSVTILRVGSWQPEIWKSIAPSLSEGSVFLDVGAHIGYFSLKGAGKVGKTGRVVAFEPNPETLPVLREDIAASHASNVIVEPIACTDREQMLTLYAGPSFNTGMSSLARENVPVERSEKPYQVLGRKIDNVIRELGLTRVDAIKIDVEGAEGYVLRGAFDTLKRFHPKLVIEVIPAQLANMHTTPEDLKVILASAGYNHSRSLNMPEGDWEWTRE